MRNSTASPIDLADFSFRADEFVVGAGEPIGFQVESDIDPRKIDHVWVTIRAGRFGPLRIAINTYSLKHADNGFDPRMRVGVLTSQWSQLPESGIFPSPDWTAPNSSVLRWSSTGKWNGRPWKRCSRQRRIRAIFVEAWGAFYRRDRFGIHHVRRRRASCSVRTDYSGRDGALRFYYREDSAAEMFFLNTAARFDPKQPQPVSTTATVLPS